MIKFPLKERILLLTSAGKFICRIIHAGDDLLTIVDVQERIITIHGDDIYTDLEMSGKFYLDRRAVIGYKRLTELNEFDNENDYDREINKAYSNNLAQLNRSKFRLITRVKKISSTKESINDE